MECVVVIVEAEFCGLVVAACSFMLYEIIFWYERSHFSKQLTKLFCDVQFKSLWTKKAYDQLSCISSNNFVSFPTWNFLKKCLRLYHIFYELLSLNFLFYDLASTKHVNKDQWAEEFLAFFSLASQAQPLSKSGSKDIAVACVISNVLVWFYKK